MFRREYEKIRRLGKGAFASVYKVRHRNLGYIRALKVCHSFIEDENDQAWKTFVNECKVLLSIGNGCHPNIVHIYQPRLIDNKAMVEMDCVEGDTLYDYIRKTPYVSDDEILAFARQIVGAVAYCHHDIYKYMMHPVDDNLRIDPTDGTKYIISPTKESEMIKKYGIVHNDLHSNNIIRRHYDGQYVLLDFGLAIQDSHCVKSSSRFDGAIEYSSPEKLERGTMSPASDVYALGVLLFEMMTGQVPFALDSAEKNSPEAARAEVYQQHLQTTPPSVNDLRRKAFMRAFPDRQYNSSLPEGFSSIVMKCLEKDPERRYADAKKLYQAIMQCIDTQRQRNADLLDQYRKRAELAERALEETRKILTTESNNSILTADQQLQAKITEMHQLVSIDQLAKKLNNAENILQKTRTSLVKAARKADFPNEILLEIISDIPIDRTSELS